MCQRYPAGILIYMTMKSMTLFMIDYMYHKPEVKHEIARARLLCVDSMDLDKFQLGRLGLQPTR